MIDITIEEVVEILKKHRTGENGVINLRGMVIDGSIDISGIKAKYSIFQDYQTAGIIIKQDHQTASLMELQDTEGLEKNGYWMKKRSLEERVNELDIDDGLKKEIVEKLREKK